MKSFKREKNLPGKKHRTVKLLKNIKALYNSRSAVIIGKADIVGGFHMSAVSCWNSVRL